MNSRPILNVRSIDFDGCLFNKDYIDNCLPTKVVKKKVTFADTKAKQNSATRNFFNLAVSTAETFSGEEEVMAVTPSSSIAASSFSESPSIASDSFLSDSGSLTPSASLTPSSSIAHLYPDLPEVKSDSFVDLDTPYAQFIKARDLLANLSTQDAYDPLLKEAAVNILQAVKTIKNPTVDERLMQTRVLMNTAALMQNPNDAKNMNAYTAMLTDLSRTNRTWTRIIGGAVLAFLGVALIAASIAAAVLTNGFAIPLTIKGTQVGVGLVAWGVAIATGIALISGLGGICGVYRGAKYCNEGLNNKRVASAGHAFWQAVQVKRHEGPELKDEISPLVGEVSARRGG